jgi:hypothetical protein
MAEVITVSGVGASIDSTNYATLVWQLSGSWVGVFEVEISNDGLVWDTTQILSANSPYPNDSAESNGVYSTHSTARYARYKVKIQSGSLELSVIGRIWDGMRGADMVAAALDPANDIQMSVKLAGIPTDAQGSLLPADCKGPYFMKGTVNNTVLLLLDTTGYAGLAVQSIGVWAGGLTAYASNDKVSWVPVAGVYTQGYPSATAYSQGYFIYYPCVGKFIRVMISSYTSGTVEAVAYLRSTVPTAQYSFSSFSAIGGSGIVQEDTAYPAAVNTNTPMPLPIGGIARTPTSAPSTILLNDAVRAGFTRQGAIHTQTAAYNQIDVPEYQKLLAYQLGNLPAMPVVLADKVEGVGMVELLSQVVTELKIMNQQLYDLPRVLSAGSTALDTPEQYRNDPTFFN